MQAYNVDADDDYEFHRHGSAVAEYRGSGHGVYRGYGDGGKDASAPSSARGYVSGATGTFGSHGHGRVGPSSSSYGSGGGAGAGTHGSNGTGYMSHGGGGGGTSHYVGGSSRSVPSSAPLSDKPPQVGDARYAAAQAAVAAALGHATISGTPTMPASSHAGSGYGSYSSAYGASGGGGGSGSGMSRAPSPATQHHGSRTQLGPGGGPARYNPSNGDASAAGVGSGSMGGYHGGSARGDSSGGSQPRSSMARPGASHEYVSSRGGSRPASGQSPVSTVLGGTYHNFAVPPNSAPLGGSSGGSGGDVHYMPRATPMTRSEDSRDRDGHGGRGGKRGRW